MDTNKDETFEPCWDDYEDRVLFHDGLSGRYFYGNLTYVLTVISIDYLKLNDFYALVGLPETMMPQGFEVIPLKCECCLTVSSKVYPRGKVVFNLSRRD